ncbi:YVTN family beta-propeller protein [Actinomycetospora cinnamomea]|uniref:YVTN family beta-propeller protein n=2 Tax=Actinomycetospora cinnamomea TaxID=663609 RepID=A0A2U1E8V5_9PSEU|nr:YVTN family beta-propeller protein [Actinomycetospora cinnamomea]
MRLVEGMNLEEMLNRSGPLPARRAVDIISQVASALTAAHEAGLIHRDVKPSNILITTGTDGRDFAYLADFGITRSAGTDATGLTTGMIVGTADYMAPEQFRSEAEHRSDIYGLGCVLFRCLTGSVPFPKPDLPPLIWAHCQDERPKVSDRAPWVGTQLDGVIRKAMAIKADDRFNSAVEFAASAQAIADCLEFPPPKRSFTQTLRTRLKPPQRKQPSERLGADFMSRPTVSYSRRRATHLGIAIATAAVLLLGAGLAALTLGDGSSEANPIATVPSPERPAVSTALPRQLNTLTVPGRPETVAVGKDGTRAYMTTSDNNSPALHVIDTDANRVISSTPIAGLPRFVAVSPATGNAFVSYNDLASDRLMLAEYDVAQQRFVRSIPTGQPADRKSGQTWLFVFAISPDGKRIYVPHHTQSSVSVVDVDANGPIAQIPMPKHPHSVALSPNSPFAYVAAHMSGEANVIDTRTNTFVTSIPIGSGTAPHDVDVSPDGRRAHVANFEDGSVSVIDTSTNQIVTRVPVGGQHPQSVVFAADGRRSYVVDNSNDTISTIDNGTNQITGTVQVNRGASMIAVSPDGTRAYVASRDSSTITTFLTAA